MWALLLLRPPRHHLLWLDWGQQWLRDHCLWADRVRQTTPVSRRQRVPMSCRVNQNYSWPYRFLEDGTEPPAMNELHQRKTMGESYIMRTRASSRKQFPIDSRLATRFRTCLHVQFNARDFEILTRPQSETIADTTSIIPMGTVIPPAGRILRGTSGACVRQCRRAVGAGGCSCPSRL